MTRTLSTLSALLLMLAALLTAPAATALQPEAPRTYAHASWHWVHWHMNAYPDPDDGSADGWRHCTGTWSDAHGQCTGRGEVHHSQPFNDRVAWTWHRQPTHCHDFAGRDPQVWTHELYLHTTHVSPRLWICGWVDRHWGTFRIVSGDFSWGAHRPVAHSTAVVADREHTKGGPLFVHLSHRDGGYVLGMRGWVHY